MKTLNEQIERLKELVRKCYATVAGKNGTVPEVGERNMENLPAAIASTHDTLEELTITQNGEYTPQDGIDGFSKVTAQVVPTRIKLAGGLSVTSNCIDENGYWPAEMIDTSNVTDMSKMFYNCRELRQLDVSKWDASSATDADLMFAGCGQLQTLDISKWNVSNVTKVTSMFSNCNSLQSIIGNRTIDDVLENNISALNGLKVALSLNTTILDRASLRAVINGLADLTGQTAQTLEIGATLIAKLTEEDIAIATNKNWTIV